MVAESVDTSKLERPPVDGSPRVPPVRQPPPVPVLTRAGSIDHGRGGGRRRHNGDRASSGEPAERATADGGGGGGGDSLHGVASGDGGGGGGAVAGGQHAQVEDALACGIGVALRGGRLVRVLAGKDVASDPFLVAAPHLLRGAGLVQLLAQVAVGARDRLAPRWALIRGQRGLAALVDGCTNDKAVGVQRGARPHRDAAAEREGSVAAATGCQAATASCPCGRRSRPGRRHG